MCPFGTDVLDVRDNLLADAHYHKQRVTFYSPANVGDHRASSGTLSVNNGRTFALTFKSKINETFTTLPIVMDQDSAGSTTDLEHDIQLALVSLPNRVIDNVKVACTASAAAAMGTTTTILDEKIFCDITFNGNSVQGRQNLLTVESYECHHGCTPKLSGLFLETIVTNTYPVLNVQPNPADNKFSGIYERDYSDYNSFECGRRGKCDYSTGLCSCFLGYTGDNCNTLTTLV